MTASERAAGELVADVDTLAAAIRRSDWLTEYQARELSKALVAAGFGRIDAARREALLSAANDLIGAREVGGRPDFRAGTEECSDWLRDRAHQIGRDS